MQTGQYTIPFDCMQTGQYTIPFDCMQTGQYTIPFDCMQTGASQSTHQFSASPLGLENMEKWAGKSQGILNRLEKSGKITQNTGKVREFQTNLIYYFNDI